MITCYEVALINIAQRPIRPSTVREYLATIRALGLADMPFEDLTVAEASARLQRVLTPSTRRKHAINLRATLGIKLPCPRPTQKIYDLPPLHVLRAALEASPYAMWGLSMLFAGLRLGEACTSQRLVGTVLHVDRQRSPGGPIVVAKTVGPVVIPHWLADRYGSHDFDRAPNTVYVGIRRAGHKVGLKLNPHQLRHAYATNLVAAGASPEVLRRQMRHHHVSVSLAYYVQTTAADVTQAVETLAAGGGAR